MNLRERDVLKNIKVRVVRDNKLCVGNYCTIDKLVVVIVRSDKSKPKPSVNAMHIVRAEDSLYHHPPNQW